MARPPVIISNGGIVDLLTGGLEAYPEAVAIVKNNIKQLIIDDKAPGGKTKLSKVKKAQGDSGKNAPEYYWCLKNDQDDKYEKKLENYYKGDSFWGEVFNDDMDGTEEEEESRI